MFLIQVTCFRFFTLPRKEHAHLNFCQTFNPRADLKKCDNLENASIGKTTRV